MTLPLQGLRLVDLSRQLPGPYCSMMLADPQVRHREMIVTLSDTPGGIRKPPATFGEHTDEVLAEIGKFRETGVV
jgi:crotonobetainyl-CoA:carnitine CoA-transferase CaiB-like acyl-CoA transferase